MLRTLRPEQATSLWRIYPAQRGSDAILQVVKPYGCGTCENVNMIRRVGPDGVEILERYGVQVAVP